jgi:hypothetical protein
VKPEQAHHLVAGRTRQTDVRHVRDPLPSRLVGTVEVPVTVLPPVDFHEELEAAFTQLRQAGR